MERFNNSFSIYYDKQLELKKSEELKLIFKKGENKLDIGKNTVNISENASFEQIAFDAINILSKFFEKDINKKGIFSIHGASITNNNKGILLLGDNGSGKTTSAIMVCLKNPEIKLISGNRIFLNSDNIIGGVNIINLRYGSIKSEFSSFDQVTIINSQIKKVYNWEKRLFVNPEDLKITVNKKYPVKLTAIIFIKKLPKPLTILKVEDKYTYLHELYESISRWGDRNPYTFGSMIHLPEIFSYRLKSIRLHSINDILKSTPILSLEGNLENISDYLKTLIR